MFGTKEIDLTKTQNNQLAGFGNSKEKTIRLSIAYNKKLLVLIMNEDFAKTVRDVIDMTLPY
jgi:hypothetical protein